MQPRLRLLAVLGVVALSAGVAVAVIEALGQTPSRMVASRERSPGPVGASPRAPDRSEDDKAPRTRSPAIRWRDSRSLGEPGSGRLVRGVLLPPGGEHYFTWDPVLRRHPNRAWRRWGNDDLVRTTLAVIDDFAEAHPAAPRVGIGDLSRPQGGDFGPQFGYIGHATHQNGLDLDVYYPRLDRRERSPDSPADVDLRLAQDLVDRFVRAGAAVVYVGPSLSLTGPPGVVVPLTNHDNHLHASFPG
jgi:Penicillin-insensitive murein endopeptidase